MQSPRRLIGFIVATTLSVGSFAITGSVYSTPAAASTFSGDDESDAFIGTGGLILPGSVDSHTRNEVARCEGCRWRLTTPCIEEQSGNAFDASAPCGSVTRGCPAARRTLRAWFAPPQLPWRDLGIVCIEHVVTVGDVSREVRESVEHSVPELRPTAEPDTGAVVQLPLLWASHQSSDPLERNDLLESLPTRLVAAPSWQWDFGDGSVLQTSEGGCAYPCMDVAHTFRQAGDYQVSVRTTWQARFWVDGLGPFEVADPVTQVRSLTVHVGEGRALLAVP